MDGEKGRQVRDRSNGWRERETGSTDGVKGRQTGPERQTGDGWRERQTGS